MRLIAEITKSSDGRFEGVVWYGDHDVPIPFSGVLDLLRILEDVIPPASTPPPPGAAAGPGRRHQP
jgi:hypothetical protein